jgi:hypothetical protein
VQDPDSLAYPYVSTTQWSDSLNIYLDNKLKNDLNVRQIDYEHHRMFMDQSRINYLMRKNDTFILKKYSKY